ncbi:retinoblastoma-like protein 1 isoform X2 [Corticium candelabrum]|uniref:retinoblastoma-like protein 1 isoform X2 n=1 Tax=Corticium candelabrum TaxID=121492 RepID=UPI002E25DAED|nr:retinoblastoma-like protein 1 isoform X2 [Corticium candelabrum]
MQFADMQQSRHNTSESQAGSSSYCVRDIASQFERPSEFHSYSLCDANSLHVANHFSSDSVNVFASSKEERSNADSLHASHVTRCSAPTLHSCGRLSLCHAVSWNSNAWRYPSQLFGSQFVPIQPRLLGCTPQKFPIHSSTTHARFQFQQKNVLTSGEHMTMTPQDNKVVSDGFTDLKEALEANNSVGPGTKLLQYFVECDVDPSNHITEILTELGSYFVNHFSCVIGDSNGRVAMKCFLLSTRLYYRVLESLLQRESARLPERNLSSLLWKEILHQVLVACSIEVVMFCYGNTKPLRGYLDVACFPWIIEIFNIEPFDFLKVIDNFIVSEPLLSLDVINHLHQIEGSIVETLAWDGKSKLFQLVSDIDVHKCLTEVEESCSDSVVVDLVQNTLDEHAKSSVLEYFYRKVHQLTYCRLQLMCSSLDIEASLREKIWTLMKFVVTCLPSLVKNRCIDQILLCSVYGMCKVTNQELQFKHIVTRYRQLPSASAEIYRHVFIQSGEYSSVIVFYNVVFMPALKAVLLKFLPEKQTIATLPPPELAKGPCTARPCKATSGLNVYVSPMRRGETREVKMTPRTRALYSFGDSIGSPCRSASLQHINDMMRRCARRGPLKKRLKFNSQHQTLTTHHAQAPDVDKHADHHAAEQAHHSLFSPNLLQQLTELTIVLNDHQKEY